MICFAWSGFPQYAARCVGAFVQSTKERCIVVATRPRVPVEGMERFCGCPIVWIEPKEEVDWKAVIGRVPDRLFVSGWGLRSFNSLRDRVLAEGGCVYCMVDNNYAFSWREVLKSIRFRKALRGKYHGYFVPGKSSFRLLRFYGVPAAQIVKGVYAADSRLFTAKTSILQRPKRILFVGQICDRKNILPFTEAFLSVPASLRCGWTLEICGCGPLLEKLPNDAAVIVRDFVQPEQLADNYAQARIFVLPSKEEHWGLVVHEAALSGCVLLVSKQVGANEDLVNEKNGRVFNAFSRSGMRRAIIDVLKMTDDELISASHESEGLANRVSVEMFVAGVKELIST